MDELQKEQQAIFVASMANLRKAGVLTDVIMYCDGGKIKAHRNVLVGNSDYFKAMFSNNMTEAHTKEVYFTEMPVEGMEVLVDFLYGDKLNSDLKSDIDLLEKVLVISHLTQTGLLFEFCWKMYVRLINAENCYRIWNLASLWDRRDSLQDIFAFILAQLPGVTEFEDLQEMTDDQMHDFVTYACSTWSNDNVIDFIRRWGKYKPEQRQTVVLELVMLYNCNRCSFKAKSLKFPISYPNIEFRFYRVNNESGETVIQSYFLKDKIMSKIKTAQLPMISEKQAWRPLMSRCGRQFYYTWMDQENNSESLVLYDAESRQKFSCDQLKDHNMISIVDDNIQVIYKGNKKTPILFNFVTKKWQPLRYCDDGENDCFLLSVKDRLFMCKNIDGTVELYQLEEGKWCLKKTMAGFYKYVATKCVTRACSGILYLIVKDCTGDKLVSYDPVADEWSSKSIPNRNFNTVPLFINCDVPFILFCETGNRKNLSLYYITSNKWEKIPERLSNRLGYSYALDICL